MDELAAFVHTRVPVRPNPFDFIDPISRRVLRCLRVKARAPSWSLTPRFGRRHRHPQRTMEPATRTSAPSYLVWRLAMASCRDCNTPGGSELGPA